METKLSDPDYTCSAFTDVSNCGLWSMGVGSRPHLWIFVQYLLSIHLYSLLIVLTDHYSMLHWTLQYFALSTVVCCTNHCSMLHWPLHYVALTTAVFCTDHCSMLHWKLQYLALTNAVFYTEHSSMLHWPSAGYVVIMAGRPARQDAYISLSSNEKIPFEN